jgi:hypothetical protein
MPLPPLPAVRSSISKETIDDVAIEADVAGESEAGVGEFDVVLSELETDADATAGVVFAVSTCSCSVNEALILNFLANFTIAKGRDRSSPHSSFAFSLIFALSLYVATLLIKNSSLPSSLAMALSA